MRLDSAALFFVIAIQAAYFCASLHHSSFGADDGRCSEVITKQGVNMQAPEHSDPPNESPAQQATGHMNGAHADSENTFDGIDISKFYRDPNTELLQKNRENPPKSVMILVSLLDCAWGSQPSDFVSFKSLYAWTVCDCLDSVSSRVVVMLRI